MIYLGVDGGGTKTAFILIDENGRVLARVTKGSSYYIQTQYEGFETVVSAGIAEVCAQAGIGTGRIGFAFLGLSAYGEIAEDTVVLNEIIGRILPTGSFRCGNDVEAGWAGSLACRPGIHIVAGTGAIGYGKDRHGHAARAGGWGNFCGDEGSAYWLGKQLISLFGKEADGRLQRTPLYHILREEFNITKDFDLIAIIQQQYLPKREEVAKLALLVHRAALQGDAMAHALYEQAAYEHSLTVKALIRKLSFPAGEKILVSYSGGVFKAGSFILGPFQKYLDAMPVQLIQPVLPPVAGAALYAMELSGREITKTVVSELIKGSGDEL